MSQSALKVTSHVGRDLLQSAALFKHEHAVVWEYVANGLEYKDTGTRPNVAVQIDPKAKSIRISDNGRGMLIEDLRRYFQMHGENIDRKQGRPGRGFFGTGKSAAFGIAESLTITTVRNGRRSKVHLDRKEIKAQTSGDEIPIEVIENEVKTSAPNGTVVEIDKVSLKSVDIGGVIRHIERHIAYWPDASVIVNNHACEFAEPDVSREIKVSTKGTEFASSLGEAMLTIKVAKAPLDEELRGIAILSRDVWHETTLAGCDRKPFADYLFGTVDVATIADDKSDIPPFDMSRSMKLNPRNEVVADTLRFVGINLEIVRRELEKQDRERRQGEEQKRLQQQGSKIAELINNHFKEWSSKLKTTMAKAGTGRDILPAKHENNETDLGAVFGNELPGIIVGEGRGDEPVEPGPGPEPVPTVPRVQLDDESKDLVAKKAPSSPRKSAAGGFQVAFENIGENEKRAKYDKATRTIYINLDHPRIAVEVKSAKTTSPVDDPNFLRMAYEIAFTEYAIVLAQELSAIQFFFDPQDALVELRQTIDDLSKVFAMTWR